MGGGWGIVGKRWLFKDFIKKVSGWPDVIDKLKLGHVANHDYKENIIKGGHKVPDLKTDSSHQFGERGVRRDTKKWIFIKIFIFWDAAKIGNDIYNNFIFANPEILKYTHSSIATNQNQRIKQIDVHSEILFNNHRIKSYIRYNVII